MSIEFDDRANCPWYCDKCKMNTWTQHHHQDYIGVSSASKKSSGFKRKKSKKLAKISKKDKKLWIEYYKSIEFIKKL